MNKLGSQTSFSLQVGVTSTQGSSGIISVQGNWSSPPGDLKPVFPQSQEYSREKMRRGLIYHQFFGNTYSIVQKFKKST